MPYDFDSDLGPVRSAYGLRLVLAVFGFVVSVAAVVAFAVAGLAGWAVAFAVVAVVAVANTWVVVRRIGQQRRKDAAGTDGTPGHRP